ncbi:unnamed protein product, partial [Oppiella nova]
YIDKHKFIINFLTFKQNRYSRKDDSQHWRDRNINEAKVPWLQVFSILWRKEPPEVLMLESAHKYGKLYGIKSFGKTNIVCAKPDIISLVLSKEFTSFTNRRNIKLDSDAMMSNMLSVVLDDQWKRLRAIVSPTFSTGKLRKMRPLIDDCLNTLLRKMRPLIDDCLNTLVNNLDRLSSDESNAERVVDMKRVFGAYTMEVIIQVAFGTKVDALIDESNAIIVNAKKLMSRDFRLWELPKILVIILLPKVAKLFGLTLLPRDITQFFTDICTKIIAERRASKGSGNKRYDFLQLMLDANDKNNETENNTELNSDTTGQMSELNTDEHPGAIQTHNKGMSDAEMISQCVLFFVAGYETTATTISYATYLLAKNTTSQERLFEESKRIFESKSDIDYDAIERLEYLNGVVMETLRLYPPGLALEREASTDTVLTGDEETIKLFKGDIFQVPIYVLHMDRQYFDDPYAFKPERFLPPNIAHHPYAHLPFGAGPRNCVAKRLALMEAKLALLYSVYNFKFEIYDKTAQPPERYYRRDDSKHWEDRNVRGMDVKMASFWTLIWKKQTSEVLLQAMADKYGNLYGIRQFGKTIIMCSKPDMISLVLSKEFTSFTNRRNMNLDSDPLFSNMLSAVMDDQWKRLRAIVSPTFSTGKLRKMRPLIDDCLQTMINNLNKLSNDESNGGHVVDMKRVFGAYTMEVIIQVAFGTKVDALIDESNAIIVNAKKLMSRDFRLLDLPKFFLILMLPKVAKLFGLTLLPRDVTDFFTDICGKIIAERRASKGSGNKRYDFLQLMLDANDKTKETEDNSDLNPDTNADKSELTTDEHPGALQTHNKSMSDAEMISQCVLFFMAGYETTATTISYATYLLAENPESQERLFEESKNIFNTKSDIDYDAIERLEYLNGVIMETLRLYPPAVAVEREASEDIVLTSDEDRINVFKGDLFQVPITVLHMDRQHFDDPYAFKPQRFMASNIAHHPYAHLPFGAGPRNCIMYTIISTFLVGNRKLNSK